MSCHENALQAAVLEALRADPVLQAVLGEPARIWDRPPPEPDWPWLRLGEGDSRPLAADGGGIEHALELTCLSRFDGAEEARAVCAAVAACLHGAALEAEGMRTVTLVVRESRIRRSRDLRLTLGTVRLRAVTVDA